MVTTQLISDYTCSAVTDSTGNPICFVHVSMTAATGLELAWDKLAQRSSEMRMMCNKAFLINKTMSGRIGLKSDGNSLPTELRKQKNW